MSVASTSSTAATEARAVTPHEFLAFTIGDEEYGVDIQKVQEIRGYDRVTHIASAPAYVKGIVNLRGMIVPIIDMRIKLGLAEPTYDQFTVVIILTIGDAIKGMVVDSVSDVTTLTPDQIKPAPEMGGAGNSHVLGLATIDDRMLILVDLDTMMASDLVTPESLLAA
jgi:purine-binding chemotaxis protein CheW